MLVSHGTLPFRRIAVNLHGFGEVQHLLGTCQPWEGFKPKKNKKHMVLVDLPTKLDNFWCKC
jgi:hypothetical protein